MNKKFESYKSFGMGAFELPSFDTSGGGSAGGAGSAPAAPAPETPASQPPSGGASPAAAAPAPSASSSGSQPPTGAPEQEYEITHNGQKHKVPLAKLIELGQQGFDYTQKTQTLAEQQKQLEQRIAQEVQKRQAAWLRQQQEQARNQNQNGNEEELDPGQQALKEIQSLKAAQADEKLEAVLKGISSKYEGLDPDLVLVHAQRRAAENGGTLKWDDFDVVAKELHERFEGSFTSRFEKLLGDDNHPLVKKRLDSFLQSYLERKSKEAQGGGHLTGGGGNPGGLPKKEPPKDFNEAEDRALEQLQAANRARNQ